MVLTSFLLPEFYAVDLSFCGGTLKFRDWYNLPNRYDLARYKRSDSGENTECHRRAGFLWCSGVLFGYDPKKVVKQLGVATHCRALASAQLNAIIYMVEVCKIFFDANGDSFVSWGLCKGGIRDALQLSRFFKNCQGGD
jgi:hypothetical protein